MKRQSPELLARVGVFSLLSPKEIDQVAEHLATVNLTAGQTLFHEGDQGNDLYVIADGAAAVSIKLPDGGDKEIARFAPGDFFGEMSIFDNAPRSASCRALKKSVLYSLSKDAFTDIIALHPRLARKLMYRMLKVTTQRLRGTSEFVSEMVLWGEGARKRAVTDELTGVYNRRFLEDSLGNYLAEAQEKGEPLSLVMVDLDHFRQINELYGHPKGDATVRSAAQLFRSLLRETDVIARYGGDEFVIIMPHTEPAHATELMSRICAEVARMEILKDMNGAITTVTSSMGVAGFPLHATDLSGLRAGADAALYRAKEEGRNRAVCAPAPAAQQPSRPRKTPIHSIKEKNRIIARIIEAIVGRHHFLVLGHQSLDDDCISSMISFALVLHMFYKDVALYLGSQVHER